MALSQEDIWDVQTPSSLGDAFVEDAAFRSDRKLLSPANSNQLTIPSNGDSSSGVFQKFTVKNTFIHVDECDSSDENVTDVSDKPLPPTLEFLPASISAHKLDAYRMDYQRFRTGKAVGARGEVSIVAWVA